MGTTSVWHLIVVLIYAVVLVIPFWRIFGRIGWPRWLAILAFIPIVPIAFLWIIAFARWSSTPYDAREPSQTH